MSDGKPEDEGLYQVTAPHFCAGLIVKEFRVSMSAPILQYLIGRPWPPALAYLQRKGWTVARVGPDPKS